MEIVFELLGSAVNILHVAVVVVPTLLQLLNVDAGSSGSPKRMQPLLPRVPGSVHISPKNTTPPIPSVSSSCNNPPAAPTPGHDVTVGGINFVSELSVVNFRASPSVPHITSSSDAAETNYLAYLADARVRIKQCALACRCWSASYDGDDSQHSADDLKQNDSSVKSNQSTAIAQTTKTSAEGSERHLNDECADLTNSGHSLGLPAETLDASLTESPVTRPRSSSDQAVPQLDDVDASDDGDLATFMTSLRRVKTPEICSDSIEQCMEEIDRLAEELKHSEPDDISSDVTLASSSDAGTDDTIAAGDSLEMESAMRKSISMELAPVTPPTNVSKSVSMDFNARQPQNTEKSKIAVANIGTPRVMFLWLYSVLTLAV